ncbi:MAG: shikimate kinase [Bryobacteraceae bacterium]|jgi:shikimate kinase
MILKLVRTPGIYLVGFMGSGKTTVGRILADRLGWDFIDLDREIEAEQKTAIAEIFDQCGESHFRHLETEAIRKRVHRVRAGCPTVMALGGGAFLRDENYNLLEDHGVTVWLDCPLDLVRQRVESETHRPLARDPKTFAALFEARRPGYGRADYRVEILSHDPLEAVAAIEALPIFR